MYDVKRKVIVYSTLLGEKRELESSAETWGELKTELNENGIVYQNLNVAEGNSIQNLTTDNAILPATKITIFIKAKNTKSGNEIITEEMDENHFINEGTIANHPVNDSEVTIAAEEDEVEEEEEENYADKETEVNVLQNQIDLILQVLISIEQKIDNITNA